MYAYKLPAAPSIAASNGSIPLCKKAFRNSCIAFPFWFNTVLVEILSRNAA